MDFAERLNTLMEKRKITAYRLSKETGIPQSMIGRWKQGRQIPTLEKVGVLAEYFNVPTDYFLGRELSAVSIPRESELTDTYFNFAKYAQDDGIDPDDIKAAIDIIKEVRKK